MGGTESTPEHQDHDRRTVAAYTLYGFGCTRCCASPAFVTGAPAPSFCGASCGSKQFDGGEGDGDGGGGSLLYGPFRQDLEADLERAAEIARNDITWCSHIFCSGCDSTAKAAARRLNESWCAEWNRGRLTGSGLQVQAVEEVYGFGRSRATFLLLRVMMARSLVRIAEEAGVTAKFEPRTIPRKREMKGPAKAAFDFVAIGRTSIRYGDVTFSSNEARSNRKYMPEQLVQRATRVKHNKYGPVIEKMLKDAGYVEPRDKHKLQLQYGELQPSYIAETLDYEAATNNTNMTIEFAALKTAFGLRLASYEAGTGDDVGGQFDKAGLELSAFILANRALVHDIKDVAWGNGVDIYHQFSVVGKCSRYGCWGATEFYTDPPSPKAKAIQEVLGREAIQRYGSDDGLSRHNSSSSNRLYEHHHHYHHHHHHYYGSVPNSAHSGHHSPGGHHSSGHHLSHSQGLSHSHHSLHSLHSHHSHHHHGHHGHHGHGHHGSHGHSRGPGRNHSHSSLHSIQSHLSFGFGRRRPPHSEEDYGIRLTQLVRLIADRHED
ncbi:uncharacterized protein MONBRDRAFT_37353, partial [Monosiga brevicollis MX1]